MVEENGNSEEEQWQYKDLSLLGELETSDPCSETACAEGKLQHHRWGKFLKKKRKRKEEKGPKVTGRLTGGIEELSPPLSPIPRQSLQSVRNQGLPSDWEPMGHQW